MVDMKETSISKLEKTKLIIRSLVVSGKRDMTIDDLRRYYHESEGKEIPFHELGFPNLHSFLKSMPDVLRVEQKGYKAILHPVTSKENEHVAKMVDEQKDNKKKNNRNRNRNSPNKGNFFSHNYNHGNVSNQYNRQLPRPPTQHQDIANIRSLLDLNIPPPQGVPLPSKWENGQPIQYGKYGGQSLDQHKSEERQRSLENQQQQLVKQSQRNQQREVVENQFRQTNSNQQTKNSSQSAMTALQYKENAQIDINRPNVPQSFARNSNKSNAMAHAKDEAYYSSPNPERIYSYKQFLNEFDDLSVVDIPPEKTNKQFLDEFDDLSVVVTPPEKKITKEPSDNQSERTKSSSHYSNNQRSSEYSFNSNCVSNSIDGSNTARSSRSTDDDFLDEWTDDKKYNAETAAFGTEYQTAQIPSEMKTGSLNLLIIAEVVTPNKFWFHTATIQKQLTDFMAQMQEFYTSAKARQLQFPSEDIRSAEICVARFKDLWYRAEIVERMDNNLIKVELVDYGTVTDVKEKNIKPILKKFLILPKQAIRGTLSDIRPIGDVWTIENTSKFVSMILEKVLFGKVLKLSKETVHMQLIDTNEETDININNALVEMKIARRH